MTNLPELEESDLELTLENDWGLPVELTSPAGIKDTVLGQVLFDFLKINPETGEPMTVSDPVVVLRRSSLLSAAFAAVPQPGENWFVRIPTSPSETATKADYIISPTRAPEGGASIGFIRIYLQKAEQS